MKPSLTSLAPARRSDLLRALVRWFRAERRDLPWRRTRDPYAIWISEAMLQQTRVEAVVPYYERFLARFPDVGALARAEESDVLALWSGLGYYSRARALLGAARAIVAQHGGALPRTRADWLALPGVGPYTAGAVLSIAFGASEPLVDGNVQRVFARHFGLEARVGSRELDEACWSLARELVPGAPDGDPGEWNQALMELGARLCTARAPDCAACPLRGSCAARAAGRAGELPRPRARRAAVDVRLELLVVARADEFLLVRRGAGRMAGLWEFPTRECAPRGTPPRLWPARFAGEFELERGAALGQLAHAITHHRIRASVRRARLAGALPEPARWVARPALAGLGLTGMTKKALALAAPGWDAAHAGP